MKQYTSRHFIIANELRVDPLCIDIAHFGPCAPSSGLQSSFPNPLLHQSIYISFSGDLRSEVHHQSRERERDGSHGFEQHDNGGDDIVGTRDW